VAAGPEGPDWELRFLAPDGPLAVRPFEAVLLDALFGPGPGRDPVRLSAIGGRGEPLAATVCRALDRALATAGLTTPRALPWMLRGAGVALAALAGGLALCAGAGTAVLALACGLGAAPLLLLGWCPWRRTRHGLARLGELRAFAQALARQEPDQLARMPAEARRAGLAWAVALGAEGGWLAALDEAPAEEPPAWYHASGQRRAVVAGRFVHAATRALHAGRRAG